MTFRYENTNDPRLTGTIADLMLRGPAARAAAAQRIGDVQARGAQQEAGAWSGAIQNIGQLVSNIPGQIQQQKRAALQDEIGTQQLQDMRANAADRVTQRTEQDAARHQALTSQIGLALHDRLRPDDPTGNLAAMQEALNTAEQHQLITSEQAQQFGAMASADPSKIPDVAKQWAGMTAAGRAEIEKTITNKPGEVTTSRWDNTPVGTSIPEKAKYQSKTALLDGEPRELSFEEGSGKYFYNGEEVTGRVQPVPKETVRTESDKALDAYAKSIGKTKSEDLTYAERFDFEKKKAQLASDLGFAQHQRERQYDNANPAPVKPVDQGKLEQEYRTVLARGLSSRSGGLGGEDAKVQQANHLTSLMDQFYDPKTGDYNIPRVQLNELALGLAKLTAGTGPTGEGMMREFQQRTAKGDIAGALTYLTGQPVTANTQSITRMLKDSIERQGKTAEQNREGEMAYLRGLAPTELAEPRRQALEATSLNPLRQSREIQNTSTGERKLQVSVDGGKTWK